MATAFPYDILIDGQGYMLARSDQLGHSGRAWQVEVQGASIAEQAPTGQRWGNQPSPIELPVVWSTGHQGYGDDRHQFDGRYDYAVGMDARFPGMLLPGPLVTTVATGLADNITRFVEVGGSLVFLAGRYVKRYTAAGTIADERDLGAGKGVGMEAFNGCLYVGLGVGAGDFIHKRAADGTWSQDDDVQCGHLAVLKERLWAQSAAAQVKNVAGNPMTAADWSGANAVGEPGTAITALVGLGDLLYVGKTDGLYCLDSSGIATQLTPELRGVTDGDNCRNMRAWHSMLFVPHVRGMLRVQEMGEAGSIITSAQPGRDARSGNPVRGRITAMAGDDRWLYAALYTGTDTYILAGRETDTAMVWHPLQRLAGVRCEAMHISGLWPNPRLFFGAGPDVGSIILPRQGDNPLADADCRYATSGQVTFSAHDSGVPATVKLYKRVEVHAEGLDEQNYVDVFLRVDEGSWQYVGRADRSPVSVLPLDPRGVSGRTVRPRLSYHLASSAQPLRVLNLVVRAAERPALVPVITAVLRAADNLPTNGQMRCPRSGSQISSALRELAEAPRAVTLVDPAGGQRQVLVLGPVQESEVAQEGRLAQELLVTVRMAVFSEDALTRETRTVVFVLGGAADGFEVPTPVPTAIGSASASCAQVVSYPGTAPARPILRVTGPIADLLIRNETTGEDLDFQGTTIAAGDERLIDMHLDSPVVVDAEGADCSGELAADSDLLTFHLAPGANAFQITGSGIDANTAVSMDYLVGTA